MAVETPKNFAMGDLDMSLRSLLKHMTEHKLDHAVLVLPASFVRISVTLANITQTDEITAAVGRILRPR